MRSCQNILLKIRKKLNITNLFILKNYFLENFQFEQVCKLFEFYKIFFSWNLIWNNCKLKIFIQKIKFKKMMNFFKIKKYIFLI